MPFTDQKYDNNITKGTYEGVPVYMYNDYDDAHNRQWMGDTPHSGIYVRDSKDDWKSSNLPYEAESWTLDNPNNDDDFEYKYFNRNKLF